MLDAMGEMPVDILQSLFFALDPFLGARKFRGFAAVDPELFDVVVESSKAGCRKPDPRFYEIACEELGIEPSQAVFLDDLGINLKPARAMGMTTIKVTDPGEALRELEAVVGMVLR